MDGNHHLDVNKAVSNFLAYFESLSRLPLITDAEMDQVFGTEVTLALAELEGYNQQGKLCQDCASRCCRLVDCELYTAELNRCPVQAFRPVLCRMHFCQKFALTYSSLVKEVGDIFLESLLAAERLGSKKASLCDSPPLGKYAPELVAAITPRIMAFKEGRLDEGSALGIIQSEAEKYRTGDTLN